MKIVLNTLLLIMSVLFVACDIALVPIEYGVEQCASCKMIISDQRFGAELVSTKGKVFKYDAIECMLQTLAKEPIEEYQHVGVNYFNDPGNLFDGKSSTYLVSNKVPSPMGGFLSAYRDMETAKKQQIEKGGDLFSFEEILSKYKMEYDE